jgi:hypothetical protein
VIDFFGFDIMKFDMSHVFALNLLYILYSSLSLYIYMYICIYTISSLCGEVCGFVICEQGHGWG